MTKRRSLNQNDFYQGPFLDSLQEMMRSLGQEWSKEDLHEAMKYRYARNIEVRTLPNGEQLTLPPSTKRLEVPQFEDYLQEIRAWAAETFHWELPLPGEHLQPPIEAYEDL